MLDMFFAPRAVAVIGASANPKKLGNAVLANVMASGFKGGIYPINPKAEEILGLKCFHSVLDVPGPVDQAVVLIPARFVPSVLEECGQKGVKGAIIITAGFREVGADGREAERKLLEIAARYNYDVRALAKAAREMQEREGREVVQRPPKRIARQSSPSPKAE